MTSVCYFIKIVMIILFLPEIQRKSIRLRQGTFVQGCSLAKSGASTSAIFELDAACMYSTVSLLCMITIQDANSLFLLRETGELQEGVFLGMHTFSFICRACERRDRDSRSTHPGVEGGHNVCTAHGSLPL
jgi:hypothetical protein